ncbi:hypothetical protein vseg_012780 [Gypsophila vaccaria]
MSFRSKRSTRLPQLSKGKGTTSQALEDVVSQVIRDVSVINDQDEDAPESLNHDTGRTGVTQPNQSTVVGLKAGALRSNKRNSGKRQSLNPSSSQPLVNGSQRPTTSSRLPSRSQHNNDQNQCEDSEIGPVGDVWTSDPSMTEPAQVTDKETNDARLNQKSTARKPSLTPPPSRAFPAESHDQPRGVQRFQNGVHGNDEELLHYEFSEARQQNRSEWDNNVEYEEMEEDIDGEPDQHGVSQSHRSNIGKWSNEIQFDEMEEVEMRDSEGKRGKKGGAILPRHVWSLRPGVRFVVPFNSLHQPVKKGGYVLVKFLSDIAKNCELCPINEVNWRRVDKSCKANIIELVRSKFVIPDRPEIDKCILKHVGNKWRMYRHELKSLYKSPNKTQEQVASTVPNGVPQNQWVKLVHYWFSEKCKMLSEKGKEARAAQTHLHVTGSKSYARRRDEFEKEHGREPGALEWFLETHQRKDGTFVENSSKEFVDAAAALIAQRGSTSSHRTAVENQVFNELMYSDDERLYQRPLGYGFGLKGHKVYGVEAESRKRGYVASSLKAAAGSSKKKKSRLGTERRSSGYLPQDSTVDVERLNFAMTAMGETNQLMQGQIKMQSQQLQMQSQQLQMQSKQIQGLQAQLQQVTSLLTKFGSMLNNTSNPQAHHTPKGAFFHGLNGANRQVPAVSSEYSDEESDSTDWDSDQ